MFVKPSTEQAIGPLYCCHREEAMADEIERLRAALRDVVVMLDDPKGGEHIRDMRGATVIARAALKEGKG